LQEKGKKEEVRKLLLGVIGSRISLGSALSVPGIGVGGHRRRGGERKTTGEKKSRGKKATIKVPKRENYSNAFSRNTRPEASCR